MGCDHGSRVNVRSGAVARTTLVTSSPTEPAVGGGAGDDGSAAAPVLVPDHVDVDVPRGGRVVVVSDIHLGDVPTGAATHTTAALAGALAEIDGPGVLVIAGDGFEMLACPPDIRAILDAHPDFVAAVARVRRRRRPPGRRAARQPRRPAGLGRRRRRRRRASGSAPTRWRCPATSSRRPARATQRVRVVHGNQDDEFNRFVDPRAPLDTPLGHHVVRQILPRIDPGPRARRAARGHQLAQRHRPDRPVRRVPAALPQDHRTAVADRRAVRRRRRSCASSPSCPASTT